MSQSLRSYLDNVLPLVKDAGRVIKEAEDIKIETKEEIYDLVTEYDRRVEKVLVKRIKEMYPMHRFIGEEDSAISGKIEELTDHPTWIIDPIDGTANFVRKFPMSSISVGLTIKKEPVLGIIYNPLMEELYWAIKGEGAFCNGKRIYTSGCKDVQQAILTSELSLARNEDYRDIYLYRFKHLISTVQGIRSFGSAAVSLYCVANGTVDAYSADGLYPWDWAAGIVIVEEAGGCVLADNGGKVDIMNPKAIAASSKELGESIANLINEADADRKSHSAGTNEL